jgi:hypothetical protein
MRDHAVVRSINEPGTSRQSFTPQSINEPLPLAGLDVPAPTITSINPTQAAIGDPTFTIVVTGENFFAGTVLNFAGYDEPTTHDGNTVSTIVNMDYWHGPDAITVYVHNGEKVSNEMIFTFLPPATRAARAAVEARASGLVDDSGDYLDPDELEEEIEESEDDGDFKPVHRGRPANTLSNKRSKNRSK